VKAVPNGVKPVSRLVCGDGERFRTVDINAPVVLRLDEFADVYVGMTLATGDVAVHRDAPLVTPDLFGLPDRGVPQQQPFSGRHLSQKIGSVVAGARQCEPAIRLQRVFVPDENDRFGGRMLVCLEAKAAS